MERRLAFHGLLDQTTFVEAIPADDPLIDERLAGLPDEAADERRRAEAACLASHLKAVRTFLDSTPDDVAGALICEDDVLLRNDWHRGVAEVGANLPADAPLCTLTYFLTNWDGVAWAGDRPGLQNVCTFVPEETWGAGMYWISRRYAATVLDRWDVPFRHLPPRFMSELIVQWSGGYLCYPMLALSDAIDSEIRPQSDVRDYHLPYVRAWGYENFDACEQGDTSSPLARSRETTRVTLVANWIGSKELCDLWGRQSQGDRRWDDIEITADDYDVDYCVVINHPQGQRLPLPPERTIVFHMEPPDVVAGWGEWAAPDPRRFLQVRSHDRFRNNGEWHLGLTYDELRTLPVVKTQRLSSVTSGQNTRPGQRLRLDFLAYLEQHGTEIDLYGTDNPRGLASYRGRLPPFNKRDGILPYRYTFAAENSSVPNYFTEKILDPILGEALCFYWGCPNLEDYIDADAFVRLPMEDFERSRQLIETTIAEDGWSKRIDAIRRAKQRILEEYQFFPTVARILRGHRLLEAMPVLVGAGADQWEHFVDRVRETAGPNFADRCERSLLDHDALWKELATQEEPALVLGEDARLCQGFTGQLVEVAGEVADLHPDFDVVLLAGPPAPAVHRAVHLVPADLTPALETAAIVSPNGARRLSEGVRDGLHVVRAVPALVSPER